MRHDLSGDGWRVQAFLGEEWRDRRAHLPGTTIAGWWPSTVPGSIVTDAMRAGAIPDPYTGTNSLATEWLADRTLVYRRPFTSPPLAADRRATLVLEGVDYSARVFVDGVEVGVHRGQFVPFTAEVTESVAGGGEHLLAVVVDPAPDGEPQVGRTSRVREIKTRMSYGWDFCPRLVHQGIWRPVRLDVTGPARITGIMLHPQMLPGGDGRVEVRPGIDVDPSAPRARCTVTILGPDGDELARADAAPGGYCAELRVPGAQRWWPNGYGPHPRYRARVELTEDGTAGDRWDVPFGFRELTFRRTAGAPDGSLPYIPVVNGVPVPILGWNWVPVDLAYGAADPERVRHLVRLAADAGVTLLRVWGGGLIETDEFFDACDEAGILVWQEFVQSSSGIESTPATDAEFRTRLGAHAEHAVRRLRHHPSLAIWCGGNELADSSGRPLGEDHPAIAALAGVVCRLDPDRLFLPTSPSGPVFANEPVAAGAAQHDVHGPWEHQGLDGHYARYDAASCQLLSEFGVEGMAFPRVLDHVVGEHADRLPTRGTQPWDHLGRWWNNEELVQRSFGGAIRDTRQMSRCSQFLQADGLRYAIESQRRRWPGCAGTIAWQLDEPFPNAWCTSAVDYTGAPKPAYHVVAAAHAPLLASARLDRQCYHGAPEFAAEIILLHDQRRSPPGAQRADGVAAQRDTDDQVDVTAAVHDLHGTPLATWQAGIPAASGRPCRAGTVRAEFSRAGTPQVMLTVRASAADGCRSAARYLIGAGDDLRGLLELPPADLEIAATAAGPDAWRLALHNTGTVAAVFVRITDGRPWPSTGWMVPSDSGLHLLPGETSAVQVRWSAVPGDERCVTIDAFNLSPRTVTIPPGDATPSPPWSPPWEPDRAAAASPRGHA